MKILGIEADNPFSLFLILILLLAASGSFDPKAAAAEGTEEAAVTGTVQKKEAAKKPVWQIRPNQSYFGKLQSGRGMFGRTPPLRRLQKRRELALPFARVMPLGR